MSQRSDELITAEIVSEEIVQQLLSAQANAYAPYSNHQVASVMVTSDGQQFAGTNVEVAHYKGLCAEASAYLRHGHCRAAPARDRVRDGTRRSSLHALRRLPPAYSRVRNASNANQGTFRSRRADETYTMETLLPDAFGPEQCATALIPPARH